MSETKWERWGAATTVMVVRLGQPASATVIRDSQKIHSGGQFQEGEQDV